MCGCDPPTLLIDDGCRLVCGASEPYGEIAGFTCRAITEFVEDSVKRLEWASKRQKIVLSIAYTTDANQISENRKLAMERRFSPLARSKRIQPEAESEPSR